MIELENVSKTYEKTNHKALSHINLQINQGEMVFLAGHSGAGKTTLLELIMGIKRPSHGSITVNSKHLEKLAKRQIPYLRRSIGAIFQDPQLLFERTVFENAALPLVVSGADDREIGRSVRAALTMVGLLNKEKRYPISLSAGERQRVGIARAIVNRPQLLLADEPTGNLDPELSLEIMQLFERLNQAGTTIFIASHDLALITSLPHRLLTLKQGELVKDEQQT